MEAYDDLICIPGYFAFKKVHDDGRVGGGILVYVRNGLRFHAQPQHDKVDLEVLWLLYRRPLMPREVSHVLVCAVYHPPSAQNGRMLYHLVSTMDIVSREHLYTGCILLGDFNQLPEGQLRSYPLKQIVAGPTRNSATLDKIFTNIANWYYSPVIFPAVRNLVIILCYLKYHSIMIIFLTARKNVFPPSDRLQRPNRQTVHYYRRLSDPNRKALLC